MSEIIQSDAISWIKQALLKNDEDNIIVFVYANGGAAGRIAGVFGDGDFSLSVNQDGTVLDGERIEVFVDGCFVSEKMRSTGCAYGKDTI